MSFPLAAIAQIGGSIVSGLFGQKAAKDAQKREDTSIQRRVADAKAAGIHPLAALGASVNPVTAIPSTGSAIGEGIKELSGTLGENQQLQNKLLEAQIRSTDAATSVAHATSRSLIAEAANKTRNPLDAGPDLSDPLKSQRERSTIALPGGKRIWTTPGADAQTAEDRYGNIIEEIWGLSNAGLDAQKWAAPYWEQVMKGLRK